MRQSATALKIFIAAETLFAEQGINKTTIRQITRGSNVNLAAVNYHFSSKNNLIYAVAEKHLDLLAARLNKSLDKRLASDIESTPTVKELLEILMLVLLQLDKSQQLALPIVRHLLEHFYMDIQEELQNKLADRYSSDFSTFIKVLKQNSTVIDDDFFWRLNFLLGSMMYSLSNHQNLVMNKMCKLELATEIDKILHRMIPILLIGFTAQTDHASDAHV